MKIRRVNASRFDAPKPAGVRPPTAAQLVRQRREQQFRDVLLGLSGADDVFHVAPSDGEKAATLRTGLQRVARTLGRERDVIVRKHEDGFLVALATPERQARRRGRKPAAD